MSAAIPQTVAGPKDLHELLEMLPPGWVWSADRSGLWRQGCAMWIKRAGVSGRTEVFGSGLCFIGPLPEAVEYLRKMGVIHG